MDQNKYEEWDMCDLSRGQYFGMLKWLSRHTNRIEWVVSCNDLPDTLLAELFAPAVFEKKTVTVWTGTVSRDVSLLFVLRPDPVIFREFMTYSGFSDWGNRDIAFFWMRRENCCSGPPVTKVLSAFGRIVFKRIYIDPCAEGRGVMVTERRSENGALFFIADAD